jgi:hypothetical protein
MIGIYEGFLTKLGLDRVAVADMAAALRAEMSVPVVISNVFSFAGRGGGRDMAAELRAEREPRELLLVGMSDRYGVGVGVGARVTELCVAEFDAREPTADERETILSALHKVATGRRILALAPLIEAIALATPRRAELDEIVNLTPHRIVVRGRKRELVFKPSGKIANAIERSSQHPSLRVALNGEVVNVPTVATRYTGVVVIGTIPDPHGAPADRMPVEEPLPAVVPGVWLVVSTLAAQAAQASGRWCIDLLVPADAVRDGEGKIIGCRALQRWAAR